MYLYESIVFLLLNLTALFRTEPIDYLDNSFGNNRLTDAQIFIVNGLCH